MSSKIEKLNQGNSVKELTYEQAFVQLQEIVEALESEELSLDEALEFFGRGQELIHHCTNLLDQTELKVQQIMGEKLVEFSQQNESP